jgi:glycosyltransferase involved in cell wall biosynthesis
VRLLILNQFYAPDISPTAQLASSLADHRAAGGDEVTVITGRAGYATRPLEHEHEDPAGVRVIRLPMPGLGRSRTLGRLVDYLVFAILAAVRVLALPRQDVIVSMTTPPFLVVVGALHKAVHRGSRLVLWSMDCYPDAAERFGTMRAGGRASRVFRALKRWVFRRLDHVVVLDEAMAELLRAEYADRALPMSVIPNWEPAALFPDRARPEVWAGYDDEDLRGRFTVLYLGNAGVGHRFDTVVEAARQLADEDVAFLFVGGGIKFPELAAAKAAGARNLVLRDYVAKDRTPAVMAGAGAALIALDDVALGVMSPSKLHGYLAMRLPILYVGPAGSNVDEAIVRYECGASIRQGDADGLVAAVRAMRDAGHQSQLGERARKAFDDAYCDLRSLPRFDEVLAGLA